MSEPSTVTMRRPKWRLLWISLAVLLADLGTKILVVETLPQYSTRGVIPGFLNWTHVQNRGVAFGLFNALGSLGPPILIAAGAVALVVVAIYFKQTDPRNRLLLWALALILGGALGNLIDRAFTGSVTDFIDVYVGTYHWHTFNIADSAISVGIGLMLLDLVRERRRGASG